MPHGFDDTCQQVHRRRRPHGGHVVRLDEVDHVAQGVQTLLNGIVDFVVHGADPVGHLAGRREVGGAFESDGEGVEPGPPRPVAVVRFDAPVGEFPRHGRDDRRVETSRQQHAVGHVGHQLPLDGRFEGGSAGPECRRRSLSRRRIRTSRGRTSGPFFPLCSTSSGPAGRAGSWCRPLRGLSAPRPRRTARRGPSRCRAG